MKILKEFIESVNNLHCPKIWSDCTERIEKENEHLQQLAWDTAISIYGANTLPGHRDDERLSTDDIAKYQDDLLLSHAIQIDDSHYSDYTARCITYARLYSWAAGMSGVSPRLFGFVSKLAVDASFLPEIPKNLSYSSGDVIPASHWAKAILSELHDIRGGTVQPGEMMALINGSFVQLGYAASLVEKLRTGWLLFLELSSLSHIFSQANESNLYAFPTKSRSWTKLSIEHIRGKPASVQKNTQDSVSLRAMPQVIDAMCISMGAYLEEINHMLLRPSGNPLYDTTTDAPLSQASFLAPTLTINAGSLIEALLFSMWSIVSRTNYLLSGDVDGIPQDAASSKSHLGLIQYPKLMMSVLEKARLNCGRRIYASGSSTSYGIEDLWNNGLATLGQLDDLLDDFLLIGACELFIFNYIERNIMPKTPKEHGILKAVDAASGPKDVLSTAVDFIKNDGIKASRQLFPV